MQSRNEDVPDALFASSNYLGIPDLDANLQADYLDLPFVRWGRLNRRSLRNAGTIHFYTDDRRFSALWAHPELLLGTRAITIVEPNFSLSTQFPLAVAQWRVYQKRWLARFWQSRGVRVLVDLNVPERFKELNFEGIPLGWGAYCTRGYNGNSISTLTASYFDTLNWAGRDEILFVVYGGNDLVREACQRNRWIWIPEDSHVYERRQSHIKVQRELSIGLVK